MSEHVRYEIDGSVAELQMDDGKVNAMSEPYFDAMNRALDQAEKDRARAVVITGRSGIFSAGLNLKVLPTLDPDALKSTLMSFGRTMIRVYTFPIPTVAAISGHAIAGGAVLMSACDIRIAGEGPHRIHLNEVAIGLTLPSWAIHIVESAVPPRWHTAFILHARPYSPEEALDRGIIDRIVSPPEQLLEEARSVAAQLTALDPIAYATVKKRKREAGVNYVMQFLERDSAAMEIAQQGK